jgi:glycosyltransferase involved in cell wall biosynthesis
MRTLTVFHMGGVGGPQRSLPQAMRWLAARGEVEFVVPEPGPTAEEFGELGPVSVRPYSTLTFPRGARDAARLARRLVRETAMFRAELGRRRPDLVVVVTTVVPTAVLAARLARVPAIVYAGELHDQGWRRRPLSRAWGALLTGATVLLADGVVCCSHAVARQFAHARRTPVVVAYPPVGEEYAGGDREAARARHGLEGAEPCVLVVGSVSRGRGQDTALRALPVLRERFPAARLVIAGTPHARAVDLAYADELRRLARELEVEDAVEFADADATSYGPRAMADLYAAADVVVNPARLAEAFGRVVPEALVAGTPVVSTTRGALPEVIRAGVDGLLVPPEDPGALAGAVARLVDDPGLAQRLVASGRRRVLERFGYEQDLAAWRSVLEPVAPARG